MDYPKLKLITKSITGIGTFGELFDGNKVVCKTAEQPWQNNESFHSCVPAGDYAVRPHVSPSKGKCFIMTNVNLGVTKAGGEHSNRDNCLVHVANYPNQLEGCVAPGENFMPVTSRWGVTNSRKTLNMLFEIYPNGWDMEIVRL